MKNKKYTRSIAIDDVLKLNQSGCIMKNKKYTRSIAIDDVLKLNQSGCIREIVFDWNDFYRTNAFPDTENWILLFSEYNETEYFIKQDRKKWSKRLKDLIKNKVNLSLRVSKKNSIVGGMS